VSKSSDETRFSIEWQTKSGLLLNLTLKDIQAANSLLELFDLQVQDSIEAVRCAAFIRPRIFSSTPAPPSKACNAWNRKYPPGTEVRVWKLGRNRPCVVTRTATIAFETGGIAVVVVQDGKIGGAALQDVDPVKP
jgi:hypothetical protein